MNELHNILISIYQLAPGLNKNTFQWNKLPNSVTILTGTDSSGLVKYHGIKYYVTYDWPTNKILLEQAK